MQQESRKNSFLIVENDQNDAYLIRRALHLSPHCGVSSVCRNPSEAKAYLIGAGIYSNRQKFPLPDVVLTDLRMDNESGVDLVHWIRNQNPPLRDLPVIMLTGSASASEFERATKSGATKVARKPNRIEDLQTLLAEIAAEFCPAHAGK